MNVPIRGKTAREGAGTAAARNAVGILSHPPRPVKRKTEVIATHPVFRAAGKFSNSPRG